MFSLTANAVLLGALFLSLSRSSSAPSTAASAQASTQTSGQASTQSMVLSSEAPPVLTAGKSLDSKSIDNLSMGNMDQPAQSQRLTSAAEFGERHQFTYQQWLDQLHQEAKIAADRLPTHLTILAGDSISLWFPSDLLPSGRHWLNQGISGETSAGLLNRLNLFEQTRPTTVFVMIGINDLLRGISDETILANQQQIINDLRSAHPNAQIVVQSILPHAADAKWEGRDRLLAISNRRIQALNEQLEEIARQSGVYFLDLYPLFANPTGDLRPELSTDGLHLNFQGYQTWSIALQVYSREVLNLPIATSVSDASPDTLKADETDQRTDQK